MIRLVLESINVFQVVPSSCHVLFFLMLVVASCLVTSTATLTEQQQLLDQTVTFCRTPALSIM